MLSGILPRQAWSNARSKEAREESFALCYLAKYSDALIPSRVDTSFKRAWGIEQLQRVPVVPGGRPAYVIAYWPGINFGRLTVAIEGMRTTSQLWAAWTGFNSVLAAGTNGRVFQAWKTYADTIYTELTANVDFMNVFQRMNTAVTFTGFSMGAAVAEYLSFKFLSNAPSKTYRLVKFGSPRVGDAGWCLGRQLPADRLDYYVHADPIDHVPTTTMAQLQIGQGQGAAVYTIFGQNSPYYRIALDGSQENRFNEDSAARFTGISIASRLVVNFDNPWWSHNADCYRMVLWNMANDQAAGGQQAALRFRYLEFDDDNAWQVNQQQGQRDYAGLRALLGSPPADTPLPSDPDMTFRVDAAARSHTIPQNPVPSVSQGSNFPNRPVGMWTPRRVRDL